MNKVRLLKGTLDHTLVYHCPGCLDNHSLLVLNNSFKMKLPDKDVNLFTFNGDLEKPTVDGVIDIVEGPYTSSSCRHSITNGKIIFIHNMNYLELAGETVDLPIWSDNYSEPRTIRGKPL